MHAVPNKALYMYEIIIHHNVFSPKLSSDGLFVYPYALMDPLKACDSKYVR